MKIALSIMNKTTKKLNWRVFNERRNGLDIDEQLSIVLQRSMALKHKVWYGSGDGQPLFWGNLSQVDFSTSGLNKEVLFSQIPTKLREIFDEWTESYRLSNLFPKKIENATISLFETINISISPWNISTFLSYLSHHSWGFFRILSPFRISIPLQLQRFKKAPKKETIQTTEENHYQRKTKNRLQAETFGQEESEKVSVLLNI